MNIPMLDLKREYEYMKREIDDAIGKCLEHQRWILGSEVKELEEHTAGYLGVKHCVGVSSGTDALLLSLRALSLKTKGKEFFELDEEIITTPFTFVATGDTILHSGALPVFVDINPETYNLDTKKVREYVSQNASRVVGMIPVHLYGQACDMDEIMNIAKKHNLFVVEDVAQAFGGRWRGKKLGSMGSAGAFSFFPSKNLGAFGDAGAIATDDQELSELIRMLRVHGGRDKYNVNHIGYKARLDTLQAAVLLAKSKFIDEFNERRKRIAEMYHEGLKNLDGIVLPNTNDPTIIDSYHVYHQYTLRVFEGKRDALQMHLKGKGIDAMVYYPVPLHTMKVFKGRSKVFKKLEESEKAAREVLSIPMEPLMKEKEVVSVIKAIREFFNQ
jgi:dTDP-4-amino-4,6-dideoxygalactose transaminase